MIGQKIGRLTILEIAKKPDHYKWRGKWYLCQCDCGTVKKIRHNSLQQGSTKSCGCLHREIASRVAKKTHYKHGHAATSKRSKEWRAWNSMIRRVTYPSMDRYSRYGGRGIKVCNRWLQSFSNFFSDVGKAPSNTHTLDRIDNDGNYTPENVHWTTRSEQTKNSSKGRLITFCEKTQNLCDWANETGINRTTIQMRLDKYNWSIEKTLTTPVRKKG